MNYQATYSPDDNKLRLYTSSRLDPETYARVKAAGFSWAPKQQLFVAPMWTPERADLLTELAGEIGDEDKSLVERAEERAERFEEYSEKRAEDAQQARAGVARISDNIPLGQPILVGHHSERHARKDAERIENGMRKTVKMWETARYWKERAAGAIGAAKYKELPEVRARRIKGIEADKRKQERFIEEAEECLAAWEKVGALPESDQMAAAIHLAGRHPAGHLRLAKKEGDRPDWDQRCDAYSGLSNSYPSLYAPRTVEEVLRAARSAYPRAIERSKRWIEHYDNRLAYERAMLEACGAASLLEKKPRKVQLPLCNYRAGSVTCPNMYRRGETVTYPQVEMTSAEYAAINSDYKGTREVDGSHRVRTAMVRHSLVCVFLTDSKVHERPEKVEKAEPPKIEPIPEPVRVPSESFDMPEDIKAMKQSLREGVQVVVSHCLFPTPPELARRVVELADIRPEDRVLEPSAGTGNLVNAIRELDHENLVAIEINNRLVESMQQRRNVEMGKDFSCLCADFLACNGDLGKFDRVVMNPPFDHGSDIKHVRHALGMLRDGGRLVSIVAAGPKQWEAFSDADEWIDLPSGSFPGTNVSTAIVIYNKA